MRQVVRRASLGDEVVDVGRLLRGHEELVAELAEVGDARAQDSCEAQVDLACCPEGEGIIAEVGLGQ